MWSYLDEENTSRAAEFITDWSRLSKYCGIPDQVNRVVRTHRRKMQRTNRTKNPENKSLRFVRHIIPAIGRLPVKFV